MSNSQGNLQQNTAILVSDPEPPTLTSAPPLVGDGGQGGLFTPSMENSEIEHEGTDVANLESSMMGKRRLFRVGKQKEEDKNKIQSEQNTLQSTASSSVGIIAPVARRVLPISSGSPPRSMPSHSYQAPSSPNLYPSSPRIISPAGSQIFERDVQESSLPIPSSPAIPSHIQTEDRIPAVLDASSEAITNTTLDPDSVEIVMHTAHQPAAATVSGPVEQSWSASWADELVSHPDRDDSASNYGALDSTDIRRLSFISFSDIVQSEHAEQMGGRDSIYMAGLNSISSGHNRSPSPLRSPVSSQGFGTSPPTSKSASIKGFDLSPRGRLMGTTVTSHPSTSGGELTIETMSQALRRTGSADLSGYRSQPLSPSSPDGPSSELH